MTSPPPTGASARHQLPIVIGLEASLDAGALDATALGNFLAQEFRARRALFPNSPFVLLTRASEAVLAPARVAADAAGIRVVAYDPGRMHAADVSRNAVAEFGVLADLCHVLITVAPAHRVKAATSLEEEAVTLAPEFRVEVIRVRLSAAGATARAAGATADSTDSTFELEGSPDDHRPSVNVMQRTDEFNHAAVGVAAVADDPASGDALVDLYRTADLLARDCQKRLRRAFLSIFWIAVLMTIFYGVFSEVSKDQTSIEEYVIAFYVLLLLLAYTIYYLARRSDIHNRFIEYRALAEGARVQLHWVGCGIPHNAADYYLDRHPVELHWIRLALRSVVLTSEPGLQAASAEAELERWIADQQHYFANSLERSRRGEGRARHFVIAIFALGGCAFLASSFFSKYAPLLPYQNEIGFLSILCPAVATAMVALVNKLGMLYQVRHYSRMLEIYSRAQSYLAAGAPPSPRAVALALGQEALRESGNWLLFRRDRGFDQPASPFRRPSW